MDSRPPAAGRAPAASNAGAAERGPAAGAAGDAGGAGSAAGEPVEPQEEPRAGAPVLPKIIPFQSLARCGEEVWIENEGRVYRLRRTRQGKLILTK